jgi:hypothetical protein
MDDQQLGHAWAAFDRRARASYELAVEWLQASDWPKDVQAAVLKRAGQQNLKAINITQRDLRSNRRRPGAWE